MAERFVFPVELRSLEDIPLPVRWMTREEALKEFPMSESPTATEETGHVWIKTEQGTVNLTIDLATNLMWQELADDLETAIDIAEATLQFPIIAAALDQYNRR